MLPIAYNTAAGPHGKAFIRLPEELNGPGCFGTVIFRILNGSGYSLKWASFEPKLNFDIKNEYEYDKKLKNNFLMDLCGCAHVQDPNIMSDLIRAMER